ncbi:3445_t:CDS:2, partial [Gigaspora rosea]
EEYESDISNADNDYDFQEDISDFEEDDNELDSERANLIINRLLAASAASFKKKKRPAVYVGNSKRTKQRKNKMLREAAVGTSKISQFFPSTNSMTVVNESPSENESESGSNEGLTEYEKEIQKTIEFVNDVIRNEQLSDTEKTRYTAVMYYLRLLFNGKQKIQASDAVAEVVNGGPWLARCVRKWASICIKGELIRNFRGKFPSKSLLNDELVSLQLAAYLRSVKFKVNPEMVKSYVEQRILPQLNVESSSISIRTARRWMQKLGFYYKRHQQGVYVDGHERPDVVAYRHIFLQKVAEFDRFMSKWYDEGCEIRTFPLLGNGEKEHEETRVTMVLGARHDGFWDTEKLHQQVKRAIKIFEQTHPGCVGKVGKINFWRDQHEVWTNLMWLASC